jgi:hypothetical protein
MNRELLIAAVCASFCLTPCGFALDVPASAQIEIRLKTKISTQTSRPGDAVESVVIAPLVARGQLAIPAGAIVRGSVEKAARSTEADERAVLALDFGEIEISGRTYKINSQVAGVDNAREKVDDKGQINGILASETLTSRIDAGIDKLSQKYSGLGDFLRTIKNGVLSAADTDITYNAGVEMDLRLLSALTLPGPARSDPAKTAGPIPDAEQLPALVAREPFQTVAQNPPKPSDITNVLLIATEETVQNAFHEAGWAAAAGMTSVSKFQTFRALAEDRAYDEAPVSVLFLNGKSPDLVFEKLNNTFARRHHLRIWRQPDLFLGKPMWAVAATHDLGIDFSEADHTFIHRVDSQIDKERAKVVNDLLFTGYVRGVQMVARPRVPLHTQNATGDNLDTDGKIAVLLLKDE